MVPALFASLQSINADPALAPGARGARKLVVTEYFAGKEIPATNTVWIPPAVGAPCEVLKMEDTEIAHFTERAGQDRHFHKVGTEIYMVLEGAMTIEVDGTNYTLSQGDMIVVNPNSPHLVHHSPTPFLCRVVTVRCGGAKDKFVV